MELETLLARITDHSDVHDPYGASHIPIYQTATFDLKKQSGERIYDYSRTENPTRNAVEAVFAKAENAAGCICTNTGLSAIALLLETILKAGDTILIEMDCYGGTNRLLKLWTENFNIRIIRCSFTDHEKVEEHLKTGDVKLILCESPTNPGLKIIDIEAISALCRKYGTLLAIDNSLATFASQKPLDLGADFSVFSTTKAISGHGACVTGALAAKSGEWMDKFRFYSNAQGRAQSPFDSFLISLGLPTLPYRLKIQEQSAWKIVRYLSNRKDVLRVNFPGLENHPQYQLARKQMKFVPAMISVDMADSIQAEKFIKNTKLFGEKASFGTADSRVEMPSKISHHSFSEEELNAIGLTLNTLRVSIGLENPEDLINDIESALK